MGVFLNTSKSVISELQDEIEVLKGTNNLLSFELKVYQDKPYYRLNDTNKELVDSMIFELLRKQV